MAQYKKIYFMGVKGVGMAPLAIIAKQAGIEVEGSDIPEEFITDKVLLENGIKPLVGFKEENVRNFFSSPNLSDSLFIATGAHDGFDNIESQTAKTLGIKVISQGQALGEFMSGKLFNRFDIQGIAATGAHGKTTVSAMLSTVLSLASYDPSYSVGTSEIVPIGASGHYGKGKYFVAEADEYVAEPQNDRTPKFLYLHPNFVLINNIDYDHPDVYSDINAVKSAYLDFVFNIPDGGMLVYNGDDENLHDLSTKFPDNINLVTFGTGAANDFVISDFKSEGFGSSFIISKNGTEIGSFSLIIPGYHNAKNATGVISLFLELGVPVDKISSGLKSFGGSKRRLEIVGKTKYGQTIIDDYGHHPEEIRKSLAAIKEAFPNKKILTIFQFHTYSRTRALFSDFVSSFGQTNELLLLPTFTSQRESATEEAFDEKTAEEFRKIGRNVQILADIDSMVKYVDANFTSSDTIIVTMGAGDVYKVAEGLKDLR